MTFLDDAVAPFAAELASPLVPTVRRIWSDGDEVLVCDLSMQRNLSALRRLLQAGVRLRYVDHHKVDQVPQHAALQPGGCRVETEHSRIDATVETRISQIMAKLLDQAHEQVLNPAEPDLSLDLDAPDAP